MFSGLQNGYVYSLNENIGENFHEQFNPELTPKQMLDLGVFGKPIVVEKVRFIPSGAKWAD